MLIAITGSSGGVGRAIVSAALAAGHSVRGVDLVPPPPLGSDSGSCSPPSKRYGFDRVDLESYEDCLAALRGCDAAIHCAAVPEPGRFSDSRTYMLNTGMSYNVLRACAELGIERVVQMSSINAAGATYTPHRRAYDLFPIDERMKCNPADPYSLSKLVAEAQASAIAQAWKGMRIASLRIHHCLDAPPSLTEQDLSTAVDERWGQQNPINGCWGWVVWQLKSAVARAALLALTVEPGWKGHEVLYLVAPTSKAQGDERATSLILKGRYHPTASIKEGWIEEKGEWAGAFDCAKAERALGWRHDEC